MGDREYRGGFSRDLRPPPKRAWDTPRRRFRASVRLPLSEVPKHSATALSAPTEVNQPPGGLPTPRASNRLADRAPERASHHLGRGAARTAVGSHGVHLPYLASAARASRAPRRNALRPRARAHPHLGRG